MKNAIDEPMSPLFNLAAGITRAHADAVLAAGPGSPASRALSSLRNLIDLIEVRGLATCVLGIRPAQGGWPAEIQVERIADLERAFAGSGYTIRLTHPDKHIHATIQLEGVLMVACESPDKCGREPGEWVL